MRDIKSLIKQLECPSEDFSPIPFWFINDKPNRGKVLWAFSDFKAKGVHAVVVHPRIGLPKTMPYLSEEFFEFIGWILEAAKQSGMKIVLYDEGMYPSGSAGGLVVKDRPDLKSRALYLAETADGEVVCRLKNGKYLLNKPSEGRIRGVHYGEDDGDENQPYSADLLNEQAVERFIELTHENYYRRFKEYFGSVVIGFFTDEPNPLGRVGYRVCKAWTSGMEKVILERGGVLEELEGLFIGEENKTTALYREIIRERTQEVYYRKLREFCDKSGIFLIGHPAESDDIEEMKYFHIPAQDLVFRFVSRETGDLDGRHSVLGKCASDFARCAGLKRNGNECFGVCAREGNSWDLPPEDIKWFLDYLAVRGVNLYIPHAFYYSLRGKRKEERPPDVGPNTLYWKHYNAFSTYMKRISYLMSDCYNLAKVAVLCTDGDMPYEEVKCFYENQIEFNYLPISYLKQAKRTEQGLQVGKNTYRWLLATEKFKPYAVGYEEYLLENSKTVKEREIYFSLPQNKVRVSHFIKDGREMFFLINCGEDRIDDRIEVSCNGLVRYDLWDGKCGRLPCEDGRFPLRLERNESILLIVSEDAEEISPYETVKETICLPFSLVRSDARSLCKTYEAKLRLDSVSGDKEICVQAEEFIEWYVNGELRKVTFWNPHKISLMDGFALGENVLTLKVYGSVGNKYGETKLPYGLLGK